MFVEAFHKYANENNIELTEENINEYLQEFMEIYNQERRKILSGQLPKSDDEKIADLLEEENGCEYIEAKRLVKKALKINPNHICAQLTMISLEKQTVY